MEFNKYANTLQPYYNSHCKNYEKIYFLHDFEYFLHCELHIYKGVGITNPFIKTFKHKHKQTYFYYNISLK